MALFEWRVTPEYINQHWTEELLLLMFRSREKRYKAQAEIRAGRVPDEYDPNAINVMESEDFMAKWSESFSVEKRN